MSSGEYRDRVTIKQDASAAGSELPSYTTTLAERVPAKIMSLRGEETYRGRQLEATVDFVVEMRYSSRISAVTTTDQITIDNGLFSGTKVNVSYARKGQYHKGMPPIIEVFGREDNTT